MRKKVPIQDIVQSVPAAIIGITFSISLIRNVTTMVWAVQVDRGTRRIALGAYRAEADASIVAKVVTCTYDSIAIIACVITKVIVNKNQQK